MYSTDKITSLTRQCLHSPPYFKLHTRPSVLPTLSRKTLQQISHWDPPLYDGSGDVKQWLAKVKRGCETLQVSKTQETDVAINFMEGEARVVFERMHKIKAESGNVWGWDEFGSDLVDIDEKYKSVLNQRKPETAEEKAQGAPDADFRTKHPFAAAAIGITLIGVGSVTVLPALAAGILGAVGFTGAGVGAGSFAAAVQSIIYGGATGGFFSVLQAAGATIVAPSAAAAGFGAAAAAVGGWFRFGARKARRSAQNPKKHGNDKSESRVDR